MNDRHDSSGPTAPEPPGGLSTEAELAWRLLARADHGAADKPLLGLAVQWLLLSRKLLDAAALDPGNMATVNAAVTASSTLLKFSEKLGLSAADRKTLGVSSGPTKAVPKRRTSLDDLTPEKLGLRPAANTNAEG